MAGSGGNANSSAFTDFGCPVYSSGETYLSEPMFVESKEHVLAWTERVALAGDAYRNPEVCVDYADKEHYPGTWAGEVDDGVEVEVVTVDVPEESVGEDNSGKKGGDESAEKATSELNSHVVQW